MKNKGIILITALWIIAILTVFAVSIGRRCAISLKLTSYSVDRQKAFFIARAGILRALAEKSLEYKRGRTTPINALSQRWANSKELFDGHRFGDGTYTLAYEYPEWNVARQKNPTLYGLMDEQSRININFAPKETLANLIESFDVDTDEAQEMAAAIVDWRDPDGDISVAEYGSYNGAEDLYYMDLVPSYHCKNLPLDITYELILIKGVTPDIFHKLKDHITVYGNGRVNINTAGERVLNALFGKAFPDLASRIVRYRRGNDDIIGTDDDRWFSLGPYVIERGTKGFVEIKDLQDAEWYANIYGITAEAYKRIRELITGDTIQLCVSSMAYRAIALGEVSKIRVNIEAVYLFELEDGLPVVKLWYEQ
ncbi:MAG: general secretion pathway protein GspK [Candidatus Omnitrophica bacterium]|nr:general secretion pathway protein GspK [Candidatus Omnitrophota bacterium]